MPQSIKVKLADVSVPADDPFSNDALEREESARILTQFVSRLADPFVLAIDAPWGSGKTTFVRMWHQSLKNDGFPTLYFNAWETDFSDTPFVALVGELSSAVETMSKSESAARRHLDRAKTLAVAVVKRAVPVAIRIGTAGVLDLDREVEREIANLAADVAEDQLNNYSTAKETIKDFREALEAVGDMVKSCG